jgi:hypothetical protein
VLWRRRRGRELTLGSWFLMAPALVNVVVM